MIRFLKISIASILFSAVFACEEVIEIDITQAPPQLVIDGVLTNEDTVHRVRISRTGNFQGNTGEIVSDAIVEVRDNFGNIFNYTHNPEGVDSLDGYYYSDQQFAGEISGIYELRVNVDNESYTARDTLRPITTIDSLSIEVNPFAQNDPESDGEIYQVLLYADEPQETDDFYYFKFYRDSVIVSGNNVFVFDDKLLGSSLNGLPSPVLYKEGEFASVEIYSLTREQFVYYTDLGNILNSDGGFFSPPPANPRSNISGGALGLFQVSGITRGSILIEAPE